MADSHDFVRCQVLISVPAVLQFTIFLYDSVDLRAIKMYK